MHCGPSIYKNQTLCLFDRLRVGRPNVWNADRLDWQPCHTAKWGLAVWLGSALWPHTAIFGGRHSVWSVLRHWPTALANVDTRHVFFHWPDRPDQVWPFLFRLPAGSGHIGLCSFSPAKLVEPVWPVATARQLSQGELYPRQNEVIPEVRKRRGRVLKFLYDADLRHVESLVRCHGGHSTGNCW